MSVVREMIQNLDGTLRVMNADGFNRLPGETDLEVLERQTVIQPVLSTLPFIDVDRADLPDADKRHAWRVQGGRVVVDLAVPDLPHHRQQLLDDIDADQSIPPGLKVLLKRITRGGV